MGFAILALTVAVGIYVGLEPADTSPSPLSGPPHVEHITVAGVELPSAMVIDLGESTGQEASPSTEVSEPEVAMGADDYVSQGNQLLAQRLHARARQSYSTALEIDPENRWAMVGMIRSFTRQNKSARALWWTRRLKQERPRWTTSHLLHGDILARRGNVRGARAAWTRALELNPGNAQARAHLAETANPY